MSASPPITFSRVGDMPGVHHKLLAFGNSGAGKTHWMATAPGLFAVVTEAQGLQTIRRVNPDARVVLVTSVEQLRAVFRLALHGQLEGCRTFGIDGLTEVQQLIKDDLLRAKRLAAEEAGGGDEDAADFSIRDWGTLTDRMRKLMRTVRDIPYDVACTALAESDQAEGSTVRYVQPSFQGRKLPNEVSQYFSAVAYLFKREVTTDDGSEVVHKAMLDGPSRYTIKSCGPLSGLMDPDLTEWLRLLDEEADAARSDANPPKKGAKGAK